MKQVQIDATGFALLRELRDGRRSFGEIARKLRLAENTVRARIARLQAAGVLSVEGLVDPAKLPGHRLAIMGVKLSGMNLVRKAQEFAALPGVASVAVVTGRYDVLLTVLLKEDEDLLEFFTQRMDRVKGVLSVETFVVYKGFNWRVPYIW